MVMLQFSRHLVFFEISNMLGQTGGAWMYVSLGRIPLLRIVIRILSEQYLAFVLYLCSTSNLV